MKAATSDSIEYGVDAISSVRTSQQTECVGLFVDVLVYREIRRYLLQKRLVLLVGLYM